MIPHAKSQLLKMLNNGADQHGLTACKPLHTKIDNWAVYRAGILTHVDPQSTCSIWLDDLLDNGTLREGSSIRVGDTEVVRYVFTGELDDDFF